MNVEFFSGGAGCGKTYQVMAALRRTLAEHPLKDGQKVLALTFMHGSRRRLDERLSGIQELQRRFECVVIDSFAWKLVSRWRTLLQSLGIQFPRDRQFELVCEAAASLLGCSVVAKWVAATYPIVIVDEAQDLNSVRLQIVQGLASEVRIIVAADEFQCLNDALLPNPAVEWLNQVCVPTVLNAPRRTNVHALLEAATAVRAGRAPNTARDFNVVSTPNAGLAGSYLANAIGWGRGHRITVITPSAGTFSNAVVEWVGARTTRQGNGPYSIRWERSEEKALMEYLERFGMRDEFSFAELEAELTVAGDSRVKSDVCSWADKQRRARGVLRHRGEEVVEQIERSFSSRKQGQASSPNSHLAMTVHSAKNREFDIVVILWPAAISGTDDYKRRLLYNAITRARFKCLVLVQARASLSRAPFV